MDKNMEIVAGLKLCVATGDDGCDACPYRNKGGPSSSCRQQLCLDAAEALAEAVNKAQAKQEEANELREALLYYRRKKTSVGSGVERLQGEANYWHGQADALKWFIEFYLATPTPESDDAVEVPDDV